MKTVTISPHKGHVRITELLCQYCVSSSLPFPVLIDISPAPSLGPIPDQQSQLWGNLMLRGVYLMPQVQGKEIEKSARNLMYDCYIFNQFNDDSKFISKLLMEAKQNI